MLTVGLSTLDGFIIGLVAVLTLLAAGHLAARWAGRSSGPAPAAQPAAKPRPPRAGRPKPKTAAGSRQPPQAATSPLQSATPDAPLPPPDAPLEVRRAWVRERVVHWWVVANRAHGASMDDAPDVTFSPRLRHALGWARSSHNHIKISDVHLMTKPLHVADETVAHEVAHIFADRHYGKPCRHSKLWKQTMVAMGQEPSVTFKERPEEAVRQRA